MGLVILHLIKTLSFIPDLNAEIYRTGVGLALGVVVLIAMAEKRNDNNNKFK